MSCWALKEVIIVGTLVLLTTTGRCNERGNRALDLLSLMRNHLVPQPRDLTPLRSGHVLRTLTDDGCVLEYHKIEPGVARTITSTNYPQSYPPRQCRRIQLVPVSTEVSVVLVCTDVDTVGINMFGSGLNGDFLRVFAGDPSGHETFYGMDLTQCAAVPFTKITPPGRVMYMDFFSDNFLQRRGFSCTVWGRTVARHPKALLSSNYLPHIRLAQEPSIEHSSIPSRHQEHRPDANIQSNQHHQRVVERPPGYIFWPDQRRSDFQSSDKEPSRHLIPPKYSRLHLTNVFKDAAAGSGHPVARKQPRSAASKFLSRLPREASIIPLQPTLNIKPFSVVGKNTNKLTLAEKPQRISPKHGSYTTRVETKRNISHTPEFHESLEWSNHIDDGTDIILGFDAEFGSIVDYGEFEQYANNVAHDTTYKDNGAWHPLPSVLQPAQEGVAPVKNLPIRNSSNHDVFASDKIRDYTITHTQSHDTIAHAHSNMLDEQEEHQDDCEECSRPGNAVKHPPTTPKHKEDLAVRKFDYHHESRVCGRAGPSIQSRVFGGRDAPPSHYPWMAYLVSSTPHGPTKTTYCSGSLVSARWILTAAHCIDFAVSTVVHLGYWDISQDSNDTLKIHTNLYRVHEFWTRLAKEHDIGLIQLPSPVQFGPHIRPICLPRKSECGITFAGYKADICGWGKTQPSKAGGSFVLQRATVTLRDNCMCMSSWPVSVTPLRVCADSRTSSPCQGDSGGPLQIRRADTYMVVGVSSFTSSRGCDAGLPAMYTRVTAYLDWIENNSDIVIAF